MGFSTLRFLILAGCALVGAGHAPLAQENAKPCMAATPHRAKVTGVDERLELALDNGTRLRLSGVEPPRATPANPRLAMDARDRLQTWLVGREIAYGSPAQAPDRWGRLEAHATASPDAANGISLNLAEALIDAGLARAQPELGARNCIGLFLRREAAARADRLGLWADPDYAIIAGDDRFAFVGRGGEIVVVEGTVVGFGETPARTYLNFGPIRTVDFAVTLRRAGLKLLETAGLHPREMEGKRLRVRGQLDTRFGPQIDIVEPAAIEVLNDAGSPIGATRPPQSRPLARR